MAKLLPTLSLFSFLTLPAAAEDFRDAKFGMSPQEVRGTEKDADWENPGPDILAFETTLAGYNVGAGYIFVDEKLVRGTYLFIDAYSNENDYLRDFEHLDELLTKKYGKPNDSDTRWIDDRMKDSPAHHGWALAQGDFSRYTEWKTDSTVITHAIYSEDYEIKHRIDYEPKDARRRGTANIG